MNDWIRAIGDKTLVNCLQLSGALIKKSEKSEQKLPASKKLQSWIEEIPTRVDSQLSQALEKLGKNINQQAELRKSLRKSKLAALNDLPESGEATQQKDNGDTEYGEYSELNLSPTGGSSPKKEMPISGEDSQAIKINHIDSLVVASNKKKRQEIAEFVGQSIMKILESTASKGANLKQALLAAKKKDTPILIKDPQVAANIHPKSKENPEVGHESPTTKLMRQPLPERANPLETRKPSQKTIEQLKKAIKEYQRQDADEVVESLSKKNLTSNSNNISASKLIINTSGAEGDLFNKASKSFKVNRRTPKGNRDISHAMKQVATTGLPALNPLQKNPSDPPRNNSEAKKTSEMRLNEIKMSYSHAKRTEEHGERSIDAKLRRIHRQNQPKLNTEEMSKYDIRGRQYENSLQMNIDFLINLKKEGNASRLIKRDLVQDSKINKIVGNMVNSDSYHRQVDKDTRAFLEEIRLPAPKKEVKGIVRQKPFSIYHPTQKNELYRLN